MNNKFLILNKFQINYKVNKNLIIKKYLLQKFLKIKFITQVLFNSLLILLKTLQKHKIIYKLLNLIKNLPLKINMNNKTNKITMKAKKNTYNI